MPTPPDTPPPADDPTPFPGMPGERLVEMELREIQIVEDYSRQQIIVLGEREGTRAVSNLHRPARGRRPWIWPFARNAIRDRSPTTWPTFKPSGCRM